MKIKILFASILAVNFLSAQGNLENHNNEIIVRFNHKHLIKEVSEDTLTHNLPINQFVNAQGLGMLNSLGIPGLPGMIVKKAFPKRSWKDSISKNIYGKDIPVPPLWATVVLKVKNDKKYCSTLKKLNSNKDIIAFAEPNYEGRAQASPNDSSLL